MTAYIIQFDGVVCISHQVAKEVKAYSKVHNLGQLKPFGVDWFHLGADIQSSMPSTGLPNDASQLLAEIDKRPTFLIVGTLEPRKGHYQSLKAFDQLWKQGVDVNLLFIGKEGWRGSGVDFYLDMPEVINEIYAYEEFGKRLLWPNEVSDEYLEKIYQASSCLLYPSYAEGFGLPLIEAAKHKLPIIARDLAVFKEIAGEFAFYFRDSEDFNTLALAVLHWIDLYKKGERPRSDNMPWLTWAQSAGMLKKSLLQLVKNSKTAVEKCKLV